MKRLAACALACLIVIGLVARTASAQKSSEPNASTVVATRSNELAATTLKPNEKLKADVAKLVAETKAGKRSVIPSTQFPAPHRNNLSKAAKIGHHCLEEFRI